MCLTRIAMQQPACTGTQCLCDGVHLLQADMAHALQREQTRAEQAGDAQRSAEASLVRSIPSSACSMCAGADAGSQAVQTLVD